VATPVTTAVFDEPFELVLRAPEPALRALELPLCALELRLRVLAPDFRALLPPEDRDEELRDDALPPRDDAAEVRRLDDFEPLALFARLLDEPPFFGLDPFELRDVVFRLLCDRELAWAISPP
jgi:hypothetical protein